jgi:hypothetical protein
MVMGQQFSFWLPPPAALCGRGERLWEKRPFFPNLAHPRHKVAGVSGQNANCWVMDQNV